MSEGYPDTDLDDVCDVQTRTNYLLEEIRDLIAASAQLILHMMPEDGITRPPYPPVITNCVRLLNETLEKAKPSPKLKQEKRRRNRR